MNLATAVRTFRNCVKNGEPVEIVYQRMLPHLNFSEIALIANDNLRRSIIIHYILSNEAQLLKFADGLNDTQFDFARYNEYKKFRETHKTDSWSEQFFKLKFGDTWKEHYDEKRARRHNAYDLHAVSKKHNCSLQEAEHFIARLKEKTAPSLEKFIQKHGREKGTEKFKQVCRYHKNYIEYWNNLYPNNAELAQQKFKEYTASSSIKNTSFYKKRGYTEEEAKKLISEHQLRFAGIHRSYYEKLGIPQIDIDKILSDINKRKDSASLSYIKSIFPDAPDEKLLETYRLHNLTKSSTYRDHGYLRKDDPSLDERDAYYAAVDYFTKQSIRLMPPCPGKRGKRVGEYHVDHRFSKHEGFNNGLLPQILGHVVNLQWLLVEENCSKRAECSLTKEELLQGYNNYENKIN